jgi:hypothetical protein
MPIPFLIAAAAVAVPLVGIDNIDPVFRKFELILLHPELQFTF